MPPIQPVPTTPTVPTTPVVGGVIPPAPGVTPPAPTVKRDRSGFDVGYKFRRNQAVFRRILITSVRPGAILSFNYAHWKHDPYPLVLSTGRWASGKVVGVNLHYLSFHNMRNLLNQFCGKVFAYAQIKSNSAGRVRKLPMMQAFRCYKPDGIKNLRLLDCKFLIDSLAQMRSFNPTEIAAMRQWVREQMAKKLGQSTASDMIDTATQGVFTDLSGMVNPNIQGNQTASNKPTFNAPDITPTI